MTTIIGTLKETSLHAALKQLYARPGDLLEAKVGNSIIDIVRGDLLIEIQTGNFSSLKVKLNTYLDDRPLRVIYPIAVHKTILRIAKDGNKISSRRSPKKGRIEMLFSELVRIPHYAKHPNFSLEVASIDEEEVWIDDGEGSWRRRGWSISERRMVKLIGSRDFVCPADYADLLPVRLNEFFTSNDLAREASLRKNLASKMIYCLRAMDVIRLVGKKGRSNLYSRQ